MSWWGKLIGGYIGFSLAGPIGALLGAALGHSLDQTPNTSSRLSGKQHNRAQAAFFTATFSVMGHVCKADGQVTDEEIAVVERIMSQMALSAEQKIVAIRLFNQGKQADFQLADVLLQLQSELGTSRNIKRAFIEIQCAAAYADGELHQYEEKLLLTICHHINFSEYELQSILAAIAAERNYHNGKSSGTMVLKDACTILNIKPDASKDEVKRVYRKLMSQHHPDKLIAKGLPEEMIACATQKTQEIRAAYDTIMSAKKQ